MISFEEFVRNVEGFNQWCPPEPAIRANAQATVKRLMGNPLASAWMALQSGSHSGRHNTLPWHAMGELTCTEALVTATASPERREVVINGPLSAERKALLFGFMLHYAQPYLWTKDIDSLVRSSPLPGIVISENLLPYPSMFWSEYTATSDGGEYENNWSLLTHTQRGFVFHWDYTTKGRVEISSLGIEYGKRYPEDFAAGKERQFAEFVLQRLAFLSSPSVTSERHPIPRPFRRQMERAGLPAAETEKTVSVVVLRRETAARLKSMPQPGSVEWKHHWWVSGHYRAQWCPSTKSHKVVWIEPYPKGDMSKPLLEKVYHCAR